jgi:hypothetical protein
MGTVRLNGTDLREYRLVLAENARNEWYGADEILNGILFRYFGVRLSGSGRREIVLGYNGGGKPYGLFGAEIFSRYGNLYFGAGSVCMTLQSVYVFLARYLRPDPAGGDIDVDIPGDAPVYAASGPDWSEVPEWLSLQDRIVRSCFKVEAYLQYDHSRGSFYTYQHNGYRSRLDLARAEDNRVTNCVITMDWVLKDVGLFDKGILNHTYDGTCGYTYGSDEVRRGCEAAFDIVPVDCTVRELAERGDLKPGDVMFFTDHNQIIVNDRTALDGGRGHCFVKAVGARFRWFVGENRCLDQQPGFLFRPKDAV